LSLDYSIESRDWGNTDVEVGISKNNINNNFNYKEGFFEEVVAYFDGSSYIEIPDSEDLSGGANSVITVMTRFKINRDFMGSNHLVEKQLDAALGDWGLYINDGRLAFYSEDTVYDYTLSSDSIIEKDVWYDAAFVLDQPNNTLKLYLDGVLVAEDLSIGQISANTSSNVYIGARFYNNSDMLGALNGYISNVSIWGVALSQTEIQNYANLDIDISEPGLISYYNLNERYNRKVKDYCGNNHGNIVNVKWVDNNLNKNYPDMIINEYGIEKNNIVWEDNFEKDSIGNYTWTSTDTNSPTNSWTYNSAGQYIDILTGDNDNISLEWSIEGKEIGYSKLVFRKNADYPSDNSQYLKFSDDTGENYYLFQWAGSAYSSHVDKYVNGIKTDTLSSSGTVDADATDYTIECFWTPDRLRMSINNSMIFDLNTVNTTSIIPTQVRFYNQQINLYLKSIIIKSSNKEDVIETEINNIPEIRDIESSAISWEKNCGLCMNGIDDWVDLGNLGTENSITISLKFKKDRVKTEYLLDGRGTGNWWFLTHYNGYDVNFNNLVMWNGLDLNKWYHVAVVSNPSVTKMYIDGNLVDIGKGIDTNIESVRIGTRYTNSSYYRGSMSDLIIFSGEVSESNINSLYLGQEISNENNIMAEYKMNEGQGSILVDSQGVHDGTINGCSWSEIIIESSIDGGVTWYECTNKDFIPMINSGDSFDIGSIKIRKRFKSDYNISTPRLKRLELIISDKIGYKFSKEISQPVSYDSYNYINLSHKYSEDFLSYSVDENIMIKNNQISLWESFYHTDFDNTYSFISKNGNIKTQNTGTVAKFEDGMGINGGDALKVEDSSTNLIATQGGSAQDWSKWNHYTSGYWTGQTQYDDAEMGKVFEAIATDNTDYIYDYSSYTINSGTTYTFSIYLKTDTPFTQSGCDFYLHNGSSTDTKTKDISVTNEWRRFVWTVDSTTANTGFGLRLNTGTGTKIYAAKPQLESGGTATTFVNGSRADGNLSYKLSDLGIDPNNQSWTVGGFVKYSEYEMQSGDGYRAPFLELGSYYLASETSIVVGTRSGTNRMAGTLYDNKAGVSIPSITLLDTESCDWMLVSLSYNHGENKLTLRTVSKDSGLQTSTLVNSWTNPIRDNLFIGCYGWAGGINSLIDSFFVIPYEINDSITEKIYNSKINGIYSGSIVSQGIDISGLNENKKSLISWNGDSALSFDGLNDYVQTEIDLGGLSECTIEATVLIEHKNTGQGGVVSAFDTWDEAIGIRCQPDTNGFICYFETGGAGTNVWAGKEMSLNEWHTISFTFNSGEAYGYIDGVMEDYATSTTTILPNLNEKINFGKLALNDSFFKGKIKNVKIWNRSLPQDEIKYNIKNESIYDSSGLVSLFNFNEKEGTILNDEIGDNNGNIYGASWVWSEVESSIDDGISWHSENNKGIISSIPEDLTNTNSFKTKVTINSKNVFSSYNLDSINFFVGDSILESQEGEWYLHTKYFEDNTPVTEYKGTFNIDKTPPTGSWTYDTSCDWTNTYPTVWWSGDAGISGGFEERYKITSSTTKPTSWSATGSSEGGIALQDDGYPRMEALGDGEWYCHIEYEDNAGNVTYDYTGPFKIDTEPPALTWLNHVTGWQKTIPDLKCSNDGGLSGMQTAKYAITSTSTKPTSWSTDTTPAQTVFMTSLTNAGDGELYVHQEAFDNAGNSTYEYKFLQIDTTPPAAPNATLVNNTNHSLSLGWTNSDATSGVDYVELYAEESDGSLNYVADIDIDGDSNTEPSIQLTNTDTSYTVDGLSEYTNYRYKVRVFDKAGNFSEDTYAEMITDDITGPVVGYNLNSRDWLNTNVDETVNIDDQGGSGLATAWYKWTNSPTQPTDGWIVMGTTTNFATSQSQEGEWYLHIKATDNYNNTAYDYSGPYKIDKTAPVISSTNITIDSPTGVYDTYTATIEWFIEDQQDLSGVDRTEIGFYADGVWYYDENTLPDGITTTSDMDNITGGGSKTAIFSNVPREIDIAASFNCYDTATNNTGEKQSDLIFTPRIYASHTLTGLSDYEMGINSEYKSETKYETGINKNYQSPSSQIIDVLSKSYDSPTLYEIGKRTNYKSQTLYEAGINKTEGPAPSLQDILVLYDEPILVSCKFSQGIRLGLSDLEIDISDFTEWTMHVFRRGIDDSEFRTIFINSNGEVYVDNEINNKYDVSWFESTNDKITIKSGAIDIDELLVFPQIIDQKQIDRIGGSPFYDPNENIKVDMPDSVDMEVMQ